MLVGKHVGEDSAGGIGKFNDVRSGEFVDDGPALPVGGDDLGRRSTASYWDRYRASAPMSASSTRTGLVPFRSSSRTRMRIG